MKKITAAQFKEVAIIPNWDGTFTLAQSFIYELISQLGETTQLHAGLTWNGGSVPWLVAGLIPKFGEYDWPFFIHDLGYGSATRPRKDWDLELLALCKVVDLELLANMSKLRRFYMGSVYLSRRQAIYRAVRIFGASHFLNS